MNETKAAARVQMLLSKIQDANEIELNGNGIGYSVCSRNNFKESFLIEEDADDGCYHSCLIKIKDLAEADIIKDIIYVKAFDIGRNKQTYISITLYKIHQMELGNLST
jgi:hypothetical protein